MIDGISEIGYGKYIVSSSGPSIQQVQENDTEMSYEKQRYDLGDIIKQMGEYTYSIEDAQKLDKQVVNELKDKFNLKEEDIYELHKRGFNLENLYIEDTYFFSKEADPKRAEQVSPSEAKRTQKKSTYANYKIATLKEENDNMYLNALKSGQPITVQSLYQNNYQGHFKKVNTTYTKADINNILQMNGLSINAGNTWAVDKLMSYGMDVNKEDILKLQNIKAAVEGLDDNASEDKVLVNNDQLQYDPNAVTRITDELGMVTDEHIEALIEEGQEVNIVNLRDSIYKNTQAVLKEQKKAYGEAAYEVDYSKQEQVEEIKEQIDQIRAKLTTEAAQKISEKMPLESSKLADVVQALNAIEEEKIVAALNGVGLEVNNENIEAVTEVMDTTWMMRLYPAQTLEVEVQTNEEATLKDIKTVLSAYFENETPVEQRFGENISRVEGQIEALLKGQGIEVTPEIIQAAKALITNGMEVNSESIKAVMDTVVKINTFLEEMTPVQAASLIKEGLNPYYASVDTVLNWISDEKMEGLKTSVAETIVALEEAHQINEEQKESLIGLYRIMNAVSRDKEQVIGYLFKNELPLTVEKLQEATKYIRSKTHVEVAIDDDFGGINKKESEKQTAKELIVNNREKAEKTVELVRMLEEMELPISESNISKLSKITAMLYPYIKGQFKKELGSFEGMFTLPQSFLEKLEVVQNTPAEVIENMMNRNIPLTLSNIYWMEKLAEKTDVYGALLDEQGLLKEELPDDLESFEEYLSGLEKKAGKEQEEATLSGDINKYRNCKKIQEATHFQRQLIDKEGIYQIPFMINGERRMVNLYVEKDEVKKGSFDTSHFKAVISYNTKHLGEVRAFVELKGDNIGYRIEGENQEATDELKAHEAYLKELLASVGYNVQYSSYQKDDTDKEVKEPQTVGKRGEGLFEEIV